MKFWKKKKAEPTPSPDMPSESNLKSLTHGGYDYSKIPAYYSKKYAGPFPNKPFKVSCTCGSIHYDHVHAPITGAPMELKNYSVPSTMDPAKLQVENQTGESLGTVLGYEFDEKFNVWSVQVALMMPSDPYYLKKKPLPKKPSNFNYGKETEKAYYAELIEKMKLIEAMTAHQQAASKYPSKYANGGYIPGPGKAKFKGPNPQQVIMDELDFWPGERLSPRPKREDTEAAYWDE